MLEGVDAYARFLSAVRDPSALDAYRAEHPDAEREIAVLEKLPPPVNTLPLRILARIARHARAGSLEWTYALKTNADAGWPLTTWFDRYRDVLRALVPEAWVGDAWTWQSPPTVDPTDAGRIAWPTLLAAAEEFAVEAETHADWDVVALYVLLRDWAADLDPLLAELDHPLESLLLVLRDAVSAAERVGETPGAFPTDPEEPGVQDAVLSEQRVRDDFGLPTSAWTIFAGFVYWPSDALEDLLPFDGALVHSRISRLLVRSGNYRPASRITSDLCIGREEDDRLNYRVYVDAIVRCILDPRTEPPLTIGIKARWGIGKTSLMKMVRERLTAPDPTLAGRPKQRGSVLPFLHDLARGNVLRFLRDLARARDEDRDVVLQRWIGPVGRSRRVTVWFNAWKYQSSEQIWAGLAHSIVTAAEAAMNRRQRTLFRLAREAHRVRYGELRRRVYAAAVTRVAPAALLAILVALAAALAWAIAPHVPLAEAWVHRGSLAGFVVAGVVGVLGGATKAAKFLAIDFSRADTELVDDPGYERRLGFLHAVEADVRQVLAVCASEKRPLVVFIDDLDRCRHETVAEVIEAINAFLAGDYRQCIFVIAMEPDVVATHIELAYERLAAALAEEGDGRRFGWHFLEKMVQLPLSLPPPERPQMQSYLDTILADAESDGDSAGVRERIKERIEAAQPRVGSVAEAGKAVAFEEAGADPVAHAEAASVVMEYAAEKLDEQHPLTRQVVAAYADLLDPNPREVKRYVNVFRFYALIQIGREVLDQSAPSFLGTGKVALLAVRWPHLLSVLGRDIEFEGQRMKVLTFLEHLSRLFGNDDEKWHVAVGATGASRRVQAELRTPALRAALAREPLVGETASAFL